MIDTEIIHRIFEKYKQYMTLDLKLLFATQTLNQHSPDTAQRGDSLTYIISQRFNRLAPYQILPIIFHFHIQLQAVIFFVIGLFRAEDGSSGLPGDRLSTN